MNNMTNEELIELINFYRVDDLTGLMMRKDLFKLVDSKIENKDKFILSIVDINNLHTINKQGMEIGDKLIKKIADILKETYGIDNVYRYGGDEFVIIHNQDFGLLDKVSDITYAETLYDGSSSYGNVFNETNKKLIINKPDGRKNCIYRGFKCNSWSKQCY